MFYKPSAFGGWNWFGIQLDNNVQFTGAYALVYDSNGNTIYKKKNVGEYANLLDERGKNHYLDKGVTITVLDYTHSPKTGIKYPIKWRIQVPAWELDLTITPWIKHQFGYHADHSEWAENASAAVGTYKGKPVTGHAWGENVNYASESTRFIQQLDTAGIVASVVPSPSSTTVVSSKVEILENADWEVQKRSGWWMWIWTLIFLALVYVVVRYFARHSKPNPFVKQPPHSSKGLARVL